MTEKCPHDPPCPPAEALDRDAARSVSAHPDQGWTLLCNGVIVFEDTGEILPDGRTIKPRRGPAPHWPNATSMDRRVLLTLLRLGDARAALVDATRSAELALAVRAHVPPRTGLVAHVVATLRRWLA